MKRLFGLACLVVAGCVMAQPVYRCGNTYSHEPCLNAKVVDTTYTEGLDSFSGKKQIPPHEVFKRGMRDITNGMTGQPMKGAGVQERYDTQLRRTKNWLTFEQRRRCEELDKLLPLEKDPQRLYELRLEYRRGRC